MRFDRRGVLPGLAAAVLAASALAACGSRSSAPIYTTAPHPAKGKLVIGIDFTEPGLGYRSGDSYSGFDVDTARYVAHYLGYPEQSIVWKPVVPGDREKLLESHRVDMVFATYSITPARARLVDFAGPYFIAHQGLLIRRDDDIQAVGSIGALVGHGAMRPITGLSTLDGKRLCSGVGTTSAQRILEHYRAEKITLVGYPDINDCVEALYNGKVDAVTTDDVILAGFAAHGKYNGALEVLGTTFSTERYGVGIPRGETKLVAEVNAALRRYIADGSWKRSLDRNIAPSGYSLPGPPTPGADER
jgi:glutamate transport system substrate-binding protein